MLLSDEGDRTITVPVDERTYHAIDGCHLIATEFRFDEVDGAIQCKGQTVHAEQINSQDGVLTAEEGMIEFISDGHGHVCQEL